MRRRRRSAVRLLAILITCVAQPGSAQLVVFDLNNEAHFLSDQETTLKQSLGNIRTLQAILSRELHCFDCVEMKGARIGFGQLATWVNVYRT
jgi:hypothetical protein